MNEADNGFEYEGCSTALARKENPQTSKEAAVKMVKSGALNRQEEMVYNAIKNYSSHVVTLKEYEDFTTKDIVRWLCGNLYKAYDICRKRFSGLENKGKIELTGGRRDGCQVWRLK